jgi:putative Mn2+ efflux pump MntP
MTNIEIWLLAISLAMDCFTVSITSGIIIRKICWRTGLIMSFFFGLFQALMPLIGYLLGVGFQDRIASIDHWIAFIVLTTIGAKQLFECLSNNNTNDNIDIKTMIPLAIATSIDALAVGITLSFLKINILISSLIIGIITFCISILGTILGNKLGTIYEKKSRILGGLILIIIGTKILVEHLYNL